MWIYVYLRDMRRSVRRRDRWLFDDDAWPAIQRKYQLRKSLSLAGQPSREESRRAGGALLRICIEHIYAQTYLTILQMMQVNHTCVKSDFAHRLLLVGDETNSGREASALMLLEGTTAALPTSYSDFLLMENTEAMYACAVCNVYMLAG